jgi:phosphatidylglycerophosphate synthase
MESSKHDPSDRRPALPRRFGWVQAMAAWLAKAGLSPNAISVCGFIAAALAGWLWSMTDTQPELARLLWLTGIFFMLLRILANNLDGLVAVEWGKASKVGLLYNDVPDRLSDTALLIGMGCAQGGDLTLGITAAGVAVFVSYVRLIGRTAGAPSDFCGPMDKGGRIITLMLAALFMGLAPSSWLAAASGTSAPATLALIVVCAGGIFTAARRLLHASRFLRQKE